MTFLASMAATSNCPKANPAFVHECSSNLPFLQGHQGCRLARCLLGLHQGKLHEKIIITINLSFSPCTCVPKVQLNQSTSAMVVRLKSFVSIRHFAITFAKQCGTIIACFKADVSSPGSSSGQVLLFFWPVVILFCFTLSLLSH